MPKPANFFDAAHQKLILQGHRVSPLSAVTTCVPCSCKTFPSATPCILLISIYSLRFGSSIVPSRKMSVILFSELEPLSAPKETANLLQNNYIILLFNYLHFPKILSKALLPRDDKGLPTTDSLLWPPRRAGFCLVSRKVSQF